MLDQTKYPYPFLTVIARDGSKAQVNRHKVNLYSLNVISRPYPRNRWGNWSEITSDIEIFKVTGNLPAPVSKYT